MTQEQYTAALALAQQICREGRIYGPTYTCTTFAAEVASAAGQTLPAARSAAETVFGLNVPPTDNPNTLKENVEREREKLPLGRGEYWNAPATPGAQAQVLDKNAQEIVNLANSQMNRMAFLILNALNMKEMLATLDRVAAQTDLKRSLIDMLPVAQDVDKLRLTAALQAVQIKQLGPVSPEQIAMVAGIDPALPDDQKTEITTYLGGT